MGTISDKLTYLNTTKTKIREGLNSLGADLDTEDTFRSYVDAIDEIYEEYPKITGEGTDLSLDNTKQASMQIDYKGNTSQVSYSGINLLGIPDQTFTHYGVQVTIKDGEITLNGTATGNGTYNLTPINTTNLSGTYTLSLNKVSGSITNDSESRSNFNVRNASSTSFIFSVLLDGTSSNYAFNNSTEVIFGVYVYTGVTYNNFKFKPQLETGSSARNWQPYVGGIPSPNPSYPQPINVVSGDNTINVEGKNLFNPNDLVTGIFINTTTGEETTNNVWTQTKLISIGNISSVTSSNTVLADSAGRFEMSQYDENKNWIKSAQYGNTTAYLFTINLEANTRYIRFGFRNDKGFTNIMLLKGTYTSETIPTYEPYIGHSYLISLGNIELCKIGTYQDYIYKDNGSWYLHKEIGKVVLNGSEGDWTTQTQTGFYRYGLTINDMNNVSSLANEILIKSTGFRGISFNDRGSDTSETIYVVSNGQQHGFFVNTQFTSITNFKTWLSNNNTEAYYVLAIPTNTPITDTTLINQLEESKLSYISQTNISQVNNDLPFNLDVKALRGE